jgi:hypothetical protein
VYPDVTAVVLSILVIFFLAISYLTRTAEASAACGDGMWDLTLP